MHSDASRVRHTGALRALIYQFFPGGGIGRYTHELARALSRRDDVTAEVVCSPDYEFRDASDYGVWTGLRSISSSNSLMRRSRFLLGQVTNPRRLLRHAMAERSDVVHFSNINHLTFPFWQERLQSLKCVVTATAHDVRRAVAILNRRWEDAALRKFYCACDAIFVHSDAQRDDLICFANVDPSRVHRVPHGLYQYDRSLRSREDLRRQYGVPAGRNVALCFGSVRDDKNLAATLRGLQLLQSRPFVVVAGRTGGKGHQSGDWYRQLIRELGLEDDVLLLDRHIADDEVGDLFRLTDVALLTYRRTFTSQSGVLNVAMHFETPVIATPAPTIAETVSRFQVGIVCDDDSPAAIAAGLRQWQTSGVPVEPERFREYERENSWDRNAQLTVAAWRRSLGESGRYSAGTQTEQA